MNNRKQRIQKKVRSRIVGHTDLLRLSVYRSNKYVYAQAIDDAKKITIASERSGNADKSTKTENAKEMGLRLAKKLKDLKVKAVVFDRGSYPYIGRVKAIAEGIREGGITI
jgi:large subunit ribosomal protein L18